MNDNLPPSGFFDRLSPRHALWLGIGCSFGVLFTVGFLILLSVQLRQGKEPSAGPVARGVALGAATAPAAPLPPAAPPSFAQPQPDGSIQLASITSQDWVKGKRSAKVSVVEFGDTECPFCKRIHLTLQRLVQEYPNDVNWVYRHFPLTSIHPKAPKEAEATECAGELGGNDGFWKYLDKLYEVTPANNGLDPAQLPQIAQDVGLNRQKFETCLNSGKYAAKVQEHATQAVAAGAQGTPYSVVVKGDVKTPVSGAVPYEQLKQIVEGALGN